MIYHIHILIINKLGLQHVRLLGDIGKLRHILMPLGCTLSVLSGAK